MTLTFLLPWLLLWIVLGALGAGAGGRWIHRLDRKAERLFNERE